MDAVDVVVIGGGQAGLAASFYLTTAGIDHVVLEKDQVGQSWKDRWDAFTLVLPNWTLQLPGFSYDGDDPDGFLPREEIVSYLEQYAASFDAPVESGVEVAGLERSNGGWSVRTSSGALAASAVVVATGAFQAPRVPDAARNLPGDLYQTDRYRNPDALPDGKVLVVGSGQSGCQIADDLARAGRTVYLACGRSPWLPRRVAGRDIFWWIYESGFMETPLSALSDPRERLAANPQFSGRDGGSDLNYRTLAEAGVTLVGHFVGSDSDKAFFAPDLIDSVAFGDDVHRQLGGLVKEVADQRGIPIEDELDDPPAWTELGPESVDLDEFGTVVWVMGYRPRYGEWIRYPEVFDEFGFPIQDERGQGPLPGLHFVGVHFLRKRKSALFFGVGEDAAIVVDRVGEARAGR